MSDRIHVLPKARQNGDLPPPFAVSLCRQIAHVSSPCVTVSLCRYIAPSTFELVQCKSFIHRKWTQTVFRNALTYRLETSARLCKCLIARVRTGSHVNEKIFLNNSVRFLFPQSATSRETHASNGIFVGVLDRFPLVTKPARYRVILLCTAKIYFFLQSTFASLCHTPAQRFCVRTGGLHLHRVRHQGRTVQNSWGRN